MKTAIATRNAQVDAATLLLANGYLRIYNGTQPATPETALSGNTLLSEHRFSATAYAPAVGGVAVANAISSDTDADATGTATFFRAYKSDGVTVVNDGTVGTSLADLNLPNVAIQIHTQVDITSLPWTLPQ